MQVHLYKDENRIEVDADNVPVYSDVKRNEIKAFLISPEVKINGITGETIDVYGSFLANVSAGWGTHSHHRVCVWPVMYREENPRRKRLEEHEIGLGITVQVSESRFASCRIEARRHPDGHIVIIVRDDDEYYMSEENTDIRGWETGELLWEYNPREHASSEEDISVHT